MTEQQTLCITDLIVLYIVRHLIFTITLQYSFIQEWLIFEVALELTDCCNKHPLNLSGFVHKVYFVLTSQATEWLADGRDLRRQQQLMGSSRSSAGSSVIGQQTARGQKEHGKSCGRFSDLPSNGITTCGHILMFRTSHCIYHTDARGKWEM